MSRLALEFKTDHGKWVDIRFLPIMSTIELQKFLVFVKQLQPDDPNYDLLEEVATVLPKFVSHNTYYYGKTQKMIGYWNPYRTKDVPIKINPEMHKLPNDITAETLGWSAYMQMNPLLPRFLTWLDQTQSFNCALKDIREAQFECRDKRKPFKYSDCFPNKKTIERLMSPGASLTSENVEKCLTLSAFVIYVPDQGYLDNQNNKRDLNFARLFPTENAAIEKASNLHHVLKVNLQVDLSELDINKDYGSKMNEAFRKQISRQEAEELNQSFNEQQPVVKKMRRMRL